MAGAVALVWDLIARDQASPAFARVAKSADTAAVSTNRAAGSAAAFGKKAGAALGAIASIDFAVHAVKAAAQFQRSMLQIQTLAGASAAEVRDMSKAVLGLAGATGQAPEQLATSLYHVESVGLRGKAAMDVVKIAAEGAKVGMADLEETTNALTSTVASGIPGVKNMSQAMGALIAIVGEGDMKFSDLNEALGSGILSIVKGYGLSLRDVGAALATFGDNNIRGAEAATMLRMAVQALAVPAKAGAAALDSIGLSTTQLKTDMQQGGLNQAVLDLNKHMKQAGITTVETGGFLTQVFGKRAGPGLAVLMGQLDRFESKLEGSKKSSGEFASKWDETQHTVGVMFDKLRAKFQVFEIQAGDKLLPVLMKLPDAFNRIRDIIGPTASLVGDVLVGAWQGLKVVLSDVAGALTTIGRALSSQKAAVTGIASTVATMWLAWKGYTIARLAILAISSGLTTLRLKAMYAADSLRAMPSRLSAMSTSAALAGGAMIAATVAVGAMVYAWQKHNAAVQEAKAVTASFVGLLQQTKGAINDVVVAQVTQNLAAAGAYDAARKYKVSLDTVTQAALGNKSALHDVKEATNGNVDAINELLGPVLKQSNGLRDASSQYRTATEQTKANTTAVKDNGTKVAQLTQFQKDYARSQKEIQVTLDGTTYAMANQGNAANILNAALARLSGDKNAVAESQLAMQDSLAGLTAQIKQQAKEFKDHGTSLNQNTAEGRKNLEWLHQQIDAINGVASAQIKAGASTQTVTNTLGKNEKALRAAATAAGLNKDQVDALIKKYAATPKEVVTYLKANADDAATKALSTQKKLDNLTKQRIAVIKLGDETGEGAKHIQDQIDALTQPVFIPIKFTYPKHLAAKVDASGQIISPGYASGTDYAQPGWKWVGEEGPELMRFRGGEQVKDAKSSAAMAHSGGGSVTVNQTIVNPVPQTAGVSGVAGMRKAAYSISRLPR